MTTLESATSSRTHRAARARLRAAPRGGRRRFTLVPGRTVALVGESGSGKSTIAQDDRAAGAPTSGRSLLDGPVGARHGEARELPPRRADGLPGPVRLAQPVPHGASTTWRGRWCCTAGPGTPSGRRAVARTARAGQPRAGRRRRATAPARAVRRPAAARGHRPRPGARPRSAGRRRAGVDAGRVDPARRPQSAGPAAARGGPRPCSTSPTTWPPPGTSPTRSW